MNKRKIIGTMLGLLLIAAVIIIPTIDFTFIVSDGKKVFNKEFRDFATKYEIMDIRIHDDITGEKLLHINDKEEIKILLDNILELRVTNIGNRNQEIQLPLDYIVYFSAKPSENNYVKEFNLILNKEYIVTQKASPFYKVVGENNLYNIIKELTD